MTEVKRDYVLVVELFIEPTSDEIIEAIGKLREEALKEFGPGFTERVDVIGEQRYSTAPFAKVAEVPSIIFRAYPPKPLSSQPQKGE